jgi:hypothetical protein
VRKVFVDEDTGEEGRYDGKLMQFLLTTAWPIAAFCMMVEMEMKKRQVHEDEAIQLPLAENGFD